MIAVTPEAIEASSAWPTRTPAMSVRRFFKPRPLVVLLRDIASQPSASTAEREPDHLGKFGLAIGLRQEYAGIEPSVMHDRMLGIARRVREAGKVERKKPRSLPLNTSWSPGMGIERKTGDRVKLSRGLSTQSGTSVHRRVGATKPIVGKDHSSASNHGFPLPVRN
jgi:hypothetical protein